MKKIFITICTGFGLCNATFATTVNYNWLVDGTNYAQTTCETGDDLILPTPSPTKYGYHFVGWVESEIFGSWSQSGIPTPQNPIEPVFKPFSNTVLRAVGSGDDFVADSYDPETRTIIRRIGVKVLDGTETINGHGTIDGLVWVVNNNVLADDTAKGICSHYNFTTVGIVPMASNNFRFAMLGSNQRIVFKDTVHASGTGTTSANNFKAYLAAQYAAGTPVIIVYPLATPTEERI